MFGMAPDHVQKRSDAIQRALHAKKDIVMLDDVWYSIQRDHISQALVLVPKQNMPNAGNGASGAVRRFFPIKLPGGEYGMQDIIGWQEIILPVHPTANLPSPPLNRIHQFIPKLPMWMENLKLAIQIEGMQTEIVALNVLNEALNKNLLKFCREDEAYELLAHAVRHRKFHVVYHLLVVGKVNINARKAGELGVLELAIRNQDIKMILLLLEQGVDVNFCDRLLSSKRAIHYAIDTKNLEIVQLLVQYDAEIFNSMSACDIQNLDLPLSEFLTKISREQLNSFCFLSHSEKKWLDLMSKQDQEAVHALDTFSAPVIKNEINLFYKFGLFRLTPLMRASIQGSIGLVEKLIQLGANPHLKTRGGKSAFHFAAEFGHLAVVECLLKQGVSPFEPTVTHAMIPLHFALKNQHFPVVELLAKRYPHCISLKSRNDFEDKDGFSLLSWKNKTGTSFEQSVNQLLLDLEKEMRKACSSVPADASTTVADIENQKKQLDSYKKSGNKFYIERIMQALEEDDDGNHASVLLDEFRQKFGFKKYADMLNLNFAFRNSQRELDTVLMKAIQHRKNKVVFKLKRHFPLHMNMNLTLKDKPSPLSLAILNQDVTLIQYLVLAGADPNLFEIEIKKYPLHYAIETGNLEVVKAVVQLGVELHLASFVEFSKTHSFPEISAYLEAELENQTRLFSKREGVQCHALVLLMSCPEEVILQSLSKTKTSEELINLYYVFPGPDRTRMTLLMYAAKKGFLQVGMKLVEWGADIHLKDSIKRTALHWAAHNQHVQFVKWLLSIGSKQTDKTVAGAMPLHYAFTCKNVDTVMLLLEQNPSLIFENANLLFGWEPKSFYERIKKQETLFEKKVNQLLIQLDQEMQKKNLPSFLAEASRMAAVITPSAPPIPPLSVKTWTEDLLSAIREKTGAGRALFLLVELYQLISRVSAQNIVTSWFRDEEGNLTNFLLEAIKHRKYKVIDALVRFFKMDIISRQPGCLGAVETAILSRDITIFAKVLEWINSADLNFYDVHFGKCPLHYAIESGNIMIVKSLVWEGALVVSRYSYPDYASMLGFSDIAEYLQLEMDRQAIYYGDSGSQRCRALLSLMFKPESEILEKLRTVVNESEINLFYTFESLRFKKITLLMYAAYKGMFGVVKLLIQLGANVHLKDPCGRNVVQYAAVFGKEDCIQFLLEKGVSVTEPTYFRKNIAVHLAYEKQHLNVLELLIRHDPSSIFIKNRAVDLQTEGFALYDKKDRDETQFDRDFNQLMLKLEAEKVISFPSASEANTTTTVESAGEKRGREEDEMQVDAVLPPKKRRKKRQLDDDDFELENSSPEKEASPILKTPSVTRFNHARVVNWVKTLCGDQTFKYKKDCFFYANAIVKCIATNEDPEKWLETKDITTQFDTMNYHAIIKQEDGSAYGAVTYSYLPELSDELPVMAQRDIPLTAEKDALDLDREGDFFRLDNYVLEASDVSTLNETLKKKGEGFTV